MPALPLGLYKEQNGSRSGSFSLKMPHLCMGNPISLSCQKSPKPPQVQLFIRKTQHTIVLTHGYDLLQQQDRKQYQQREKAQGAKSGGNQAQASKNPLPVESYGVCLIPPAVSCDSVCETLPTREEW